jgi:hypothetical protein
MFLFLTAHTSPAVNEIVAEVMEDMDELLERQSLEYKHLMEEEALAERVRVTILNGDGLEEEYMRINGIEPIRCLGARTWLVDLPTELLDQDATFLDGGGRRVMLIVQPTDGG